MRLKEIRLSRKGRLLVNGGELPLESGKVTVLFGPSGSGKSTLLYALADLDPTVSLTTADGSHPLKEKGLGLVPQDSALFEDLRTAERNIAFAHAHAPAGNGEQALSDVLRQAESALGVKPDWRVPLSGGQKQRVAIARTIAGKAAVLLCDEPTSGLDPVSRRDAIQTFREIAQRGVAVLVVTHDLEWNAVEAADFAVVLRDGCLESHEVGVALDKSFFIPTGGSPTVSEVPAWQRMCRRVGESVWWFLLLPIQVALGFFSKERIRLRWLGSHLLHFGRTVFGVSSLVYVAVAGGLVGFSSFFFSVGSLHPSPHLQEILIPELLSGSGFGLYRVIVPLITALLVAAKCGSALAADFGNRQYGGQIAVMRTLRANPETYLLLSAIVALGVGLPLLCLLAFGASALGSLGAYLYSFPLETAYGWRTDFFRLLLRDAFPWLVGTGWNIAKLSLSGAGVAVLAYRFGTLPKSGNTDVGGDISKATLWGSLWCLVVFTLFAFIEF